MCQEVTATSMKFIFSNLGVGQLSSMFEGCMRVWGVQGHSSPKVCLEGSSTSYNTPDKAIKL